MRVGRRSPPVPGVAGSVAIGGSTTRSERAVPGSGGAPAAREDFLTGFVNCGWRGSGPPGGYCGGAGRFADRHRRWLEQRVAGRLFKAVDSKYVHSTS